MNRKLLYKELDMLLASFGFTSHIDIFKITNEYQNDRVKNIEEANNERQRIALQRSLDYFDFDFIDKYKRSKKKEKLLFRLVNSFVLQIPEARLAGWSNITKYMFEECIRMKDTILNRKKWYLDVIPESRWLIEYLEKEV